MSDQPDNDTKATLSRLYRDAASAEPPSALDRAILSAAAAAVARAPARRAAWWRRWSGPVAAFATIVLTVSLSWLLYYEQERNDAVGTSASSRAEKAVAKQAVADEAVADEATASLAAPTMPLRATMKPAPPPPMITFESKKEIAAEPAPKGMVEATAPKPAALGTPLSTSQAGAKSTILRDLPAAQPAQGPAATSLGEAETRRMRSRDDARDALPAPSSDSALGAQAAPAREAWLARIRELKKQGKEQEVKAALADFKRAHPDFRLPPDLQ